MVLVPNLDFRIRNKDIWINGEHAVFGNLISMEYVKTLRFWIIGVLISCDSTVHVQKAYTATTKPTEPKGR